MKHYKIINDKEAIEQFIEWLPELKDNEKFYCSLFARKKYCPELIKSNDKTQLKRFLATKENLFNKLQQLELPLGVWQLRGTEAPQESLVCYIMPNPRDMIKATGEMGKKCFDLIYNQNYNPVAEMMSCVQKSKSRTHYVDFDIDDKTVDLDKLKNIIPEKSYSILETRGGYHVLVDPKKASYLNKLNWYQEIKNTFPIDQVQDQMIPIPGTIQGGFVPKFIKL